MRLVTKTIARMVMLLSIVTLLAVLAVSGLLRLTAYFAASQDQYEQLRVLFEVGHHVAIARATNDAAQTADALRKAQVATFRLREFDHADATTHAADLEVMIDQAIKAERDVGEHANVAANEALAGIAARSEQLRAGIIANRQKASGELQRTITGMSIVGVVAVLLVIMLGWLEYRGVARPLRHFAAGISALKKSEFPPPLQPVGDAEFRDLTALFNEMTQELNRVYDELENKVEERSRQLVRAARLAGLGSLAAGFAHEINNPLGIVSGYCELAQRQLNNGRPHDEKELASLRERLSIMLEEVHRCKAIATRMLNLAEPGKDERQVIALGPLVERTVDTVRALPAFEGIALSVENNDAVRARVNEQEIVQVMINLLNNAADALSGHDVTPTTERNIDVRVSIIGGYAAIDVSDNGSGIDAEMQEQLFEPFVSRKASRQRGHGLGLWICQEIIARHGGRITVESPIDARCTTFRIEVPSADKTVEAGHA